MFFGTYAFNLHCTKKKTSKILKEKSPVSESYSNFIASGITVCVICDRHTWYSIIRLKKLVLYI